MIQMRSWLTVADNSGARQLTCILPLGGDASGFPSTFVGLAILLSTSTPVATPPRVTAVA